MVDQSIGKSVLRKEDRRFITGTGRYIDDINLRGQTFGYFARYPHTHKAVRGIDIERAHAMSGVVAVVMGEKLAEDGLGGLSCE